MSDAALAAFANWNRHLVGECLSSGTPWNCWEAGFLSDLCSFPYLSPRQREILDRLHRKAMHAAA